MKLLLTSLFTGVTILSIFQVAAKMLGDQTW